MKVLALASTFPRWENDTTPPFVFELEKRLVHAFKIFVLAPHYAGAKKKEKREGLEIRRFQYFWPAQFEKLCYDGGIMPNLKRNKLLYFQAFTLLFFEFIAAAKIIKKEKIDLIHAHWIIPQGIVALLLKKVLGVPYIVTTHGGDIYGIQNPLLVSLKKIILKNALRVTVVSSAIKQEIEKKIDKNLNVDVVSMGVDSQFFNPKKFNTTIKEKYGIHGPFLLFVGRLAEGKGIQYLIEAMPRVIRSFPDAKLVIVGEGTIKKNLQDFIADLELDKNVFLIGGLPYEKLPEYYATADIFVGPSIKTKDGASEGLGLTFIEAAFSGCIPIGTNVGGISDVIRNDETGFIVKEKDSEEIATTIIQLLKNQNKIQQMKSQVRDSLIRNFDWNIVAEKYRRIYQVE